VRPIPEPDYDDPQVVYTFFGLCGYAAQLFEQSIVLFVVLLQAIHKSRPLAGQTFDDAFRFLDRQTLGQLLKELPKLGKIDESIIEDFAKLLSKRNHLSHHFFCEHADDFLRFEGRHKMVDELHALIHQFNDGEDLATQAYQFIWASINEGLAQKKHER
jgi:hypothetical protein